MNKLIYTLLLSMLMLPAFNALAQYPALFPNDRSSVFDAFAPFYHGVASGDPLSDRVILWTRVTPDSGIVGSIQVDWRIATDTNFSVIVNSGTFTTDANRDYTVKVDAAGLQPNKWYYYEFSALGKKSLIGRTKTAPAGPVSRLRFAVVSCANYANGFFNVYERIANRNDLDGVIHLGDYIYEYGSTGSIGRPHDPTHEILDLVDYRARHSQYKLDPDLRYAHQQYPWITVWDDHETANDSWEHGAENHNSGEGLWEDRKAMAKQAYFEWMPVRDPDTVGRIYREIPYGDLLDIFVLDTRLEGRDEQLGRLIDKNTPALIDTNRTLLGQAQYNWLVQGLKNSTARWKVLAQQVMMAPLVLGNFVLSTDQWDGYPVERRKLLNEVIDNNITNLVVLTGDIHTSWASDLPYETVPYDANTGAGSAGVEFVATSVTSEGSPVSVPLSVLQPSNPYIKYAELTKHGYVILNLDTGRATGEWYYVPTVTQVQHQDQYADGWFVLNNERFLRHSSSATTANYTQPQAPLTPRNFPIGIGEAKAPAIAVFGVYPNPFINNMYIQFYTAASGTMDILLTDAAGKAVMNQTIETTAPGLHLERLTFGSLPAGNYTLTLQTKGHAYSTQVIKMQ